ncbi:hypothetical protein RFI_09187 [Reticulomyxa filosa]|uniref:Uncharacterized protein n=1 Tax=Reticulomyxa filosa TaxID=46433 RepID=X6NPM0_RETFI|nr:hypothetical protein RFI_09187 [Reticulomyxa filosa]|eukprot:ETO27946.1 hypothetical protein RFI_09187 [Reticulomyxa filosa]
MSAIETKLWSQLEESIAYVKGVCPTQPTMSHSSSTQSHSTSGSDKTDKEQIIHELKLAILECKQDMTQSKERMDRLEKQLAEKASLQPSTYSVSPAHCKCDQDSTVLPKKSSTSTFDSDRLKHIEKSIECLQKTAKKQAEQIISEKHRDTAANSAVFQHKNITDPHKVELNF